MLTIAKTYYLFLRSANTVFGLAEVLVKLVNLATSTELTSTEPITTKVIVLYTTNNVYMVAYNFSQMFP
jgi:hypothetical protein